MEQQAIKQRTCFYCIIGMCGVNKSMLSRYFKQVFRKLNSQLKGWDAQHETPLAAGLVIYTKDKLLQTPIDGQYQHHMAIQPEASWILV